MFVQMNPLRPASVKDVSGLEFFNKKRHATVSLGLIERDWVIGEINAGRSPLLVATDVASCGLGSFYPCLKKSASRLLLLSHLHVTH